MDVTTQYFNLPFKRVIQRSALEDTNVPDKQQWDNAIKFMENTLLREQDKTQSDLNSLIGPGWQERWMYWTYRNSEQVRSRVFFISLHFFDRF